MAYAFVHVCVGVVVILVKTVEQKSLSRRIFFFVCFFKKYHLNNLVLHLVAAILMMNYEEQVKRL